MADDYTSLVRKDRAKCAVSKRRASVRECASVFRDPRGPTVSNNGGLRMFGVGKKKKNRFAPRGDAL